MNSTLLSFQRNETVSLTQADMQERIVRIYVAKRSILQRDF